MERLSGRLERDACAYFEAFHRAGTSLDGAAVARMSPVTENLLRGIGCNRAKARREEDFALLHATLGSRNLLQLFPAPGPFAYPSLCGHGMELKRELAGRKIFVPTLWPEVRQNAGASSLEKRYAEDLLPLPCDQRYGPTEMRHIAEAILCAPP